MRPTVDASMIKSEGAVFVLYSRNDAAFVDQLEAALKARGLSMSIHRQESNAPEGTWPQPEALLRRVETLMVVVSPDMVDSRVARTEIMLAVSQNKRVVPIVYKRVNDDAVPEALRWLNFIGFDDPAQFEANVDNLHKALEIDPWLEGAAEFSSRPTSG